MSAGTGPRIFEIQEARALLSEGRRPYVAALAAIGMHGSNMEYYNVERALESLCAGQARGTLEPPLTDELAGAVDTVYKNLFDSPNSTADTLVIAQTVLGAVVDHGYRGVTSA